MEKWYSINELADIFGVTRQTISKLIKNNRIDAVNIGSEKRPHWKIYDGAYQKFIAEEYEKNGS